MAKKTKEPDTAKPASELEWLSATIAPISRLAAAEGVDDDEDLTADINFYTGAAVPRVDFWTGQKYSLAFSMEPGACDLSRLNSGAPLLDSHNSSDLSCVLGVVEEGTARIENGIGKASVRFSNRPEIAGVRKDVKNKIIRNISMGTQILSLKDVSNPRQSPVRTTTRPSRQLPRPARLRTVISRIFSMATAQ